MNRKNNGIISLPIVTVLITLFLFSCEKEQPLIPVEYSGWETTTDEVLDYIIPGHMDKFRKIFINETGTTVEVSSVNGETKYEYPDGTVVIKEIYPDNTGTGNPVIITAMVKDSDNPEAKGGWLWVVKQLETGTETVISASFCVTCHSDANTANPYGDNNPDGEFRDYLFFPYH